MSWILLEAEGIGQPRLKFIRQWTLAFPKALKLLLAMDARLLSEALRAFVCILFTFQRKRARELGIEQPRPGAVAFVQTFTSALLMHPHYHVLVPDGVFFGDGNEFSPLPPPYLLIKGGDGSITSKSKKGVLPRAHNFKGASYNPTKDSREIGLT